MIQAYVIDFPRWFRRVVLPFDDVILASEELLGHVLSIVRLAEAIQINATFTQKEFFDSFKSYSKWQLLWLEVDDFGFPTCLLD